MRAAVQNRYGGPEVLTLRDMPRPTPGRREILVRIEAAAVTTADWRLRAAAFPGITWLPGRLMFGMFRPRQPVPGQSFAGRVESLGPEAARFRPGERVFGVGRSTHAGFAVVPEAGAVLATPEAISDAEAAALPFGGLSALVFLRDIAKLRPGQAVLVVGASGAVGCYAVQIARALGAEASGIASAANLDFVRGLGAVEAIDHAGPMPQDRRYDIILDTVGIGRFAALAPWLRDGGVFVPLNIAFGDLVRSVTGRRVAIGISGDKAEDLAELARMVAAGQVRPVVERVYALERIAEAHADVERRHRRGCVVVSMAAAHAGAG